MIGYLKGNVIYSASDRVILDVNGVGYEVYCSGAAYSKLVAERRGEIFTYLQVSEAAGFTLYGFDSVAEKELFLKLISVSGLGPKGAIGILTAMSAEEVLLAISNADVKTLTRAKGLGKKTAEKIVLELHGKISASEIMGADESDLSPKRAAQSMTREEEDAVAALMNLGFTRNESVDAVRRAGERGAKSVEDVIRVALSGM